jgi:hypothetical protein
MTFFVGITDVILIAVRCHADAVGGTSVDCQLDDIFTGN